MKSVTLCPPKNLFTALLYSAVIYAGLQYSVAQTAPGSFKNPVFDHDFPDPNLVKAPDGYFYAYSTQANWSKYSAGEPYVTPIVRSKDLMNWEFIADAMTKKPDWKKEGGIWAPDATYHNGKYYLYYSFSTWGDPNPGIGLAISDKPEGSFTDKGKVFLSKEIGVDNSIDPFLMVEDNKLYLIWGSFHGIYGVELGEDGIGRKSDKFMIAGTAYEGAYIYKKDDYYYFFGSTGTCCEGEKSTYKVLAGRSKSFKGPYIDAAGKPLNENGGTLVVEGNTGATGFVGPGHNGDIFNDSKGDTWMLYHAFKKEEPTKGRVMLLDKIEWIEGWPTIKNKQPGVEEQKGPVF